MGTFLVDSPCHGIHSGYLTHVDAASIIDFEADDLEQHDGKANFELLIGGFIRIAGTVEILGGEVFIDPSTKPATMDVVKAQLFVSDAFLRGQNLTVRPTFARRIRAALQD